MGEQQIRARDPGPRVNVEWKGDKAKAPPLSLKEIWRSKTRFLLVSLVVILITVLVLFIAGLSEGLAQGNRRQTGPNHPR